MIKRVYFRFDFIIEKVAEIKIDIHTPFVKTNLYGGILLDQNINNFKIKLENVNADIIPISLGLKTLISSLIIGGTQYFEFLYNLKGNFINVFKSELFFTS